MRDDPVHSAGVLGAPPSAASPALTLYLVDAHSHVMTPVGATLVDRRVRCGAPGLGLDDDDDPHEGRLTAAPSFSARTVLATAKTFHSDQQYALMVPPETLEHIHQRTTQFERPTLAKTSGEIMVNGDLFAVDVDVLHDAVGTGEDGLLVSPKDDEGMARIFAWCFGFTQVDLTLNFAWEERAPVSDAHHEFRCDPVMVEQPEGETARRFLAMADRVAAGFPTWFAPAAPKTLVRETAPGAFRGLLDAAQTILAAYERLLPWFRMSPRTKTRSSQTLGSAEQMRSFTAATAAYIATHPDELMESAVDTGVRLGRRAFLPKRTLIDGAAEDRDTPENRAVVGFLMTVERKLRSALLGLGHEAGTTPRSTPRTVVKSGRGFSPSGNASDATASRPAHSHYVAGTALLEAFASHHAADRIAASDAVKVTLEMRRATSLLRTLAGAFPFHTRPVARMPAPTPVFERIGPYREVWLLMRAWFRSGLGDSAAPAADVKEDFVLEALDTPRLYERLVVTVLLDGIRAAGMNLTSVDMIPWPTHPVTSANRWTFEGVAPPGVPASVTLWYEPAVFAPGDVDRHGIGLIRTTSWRLRPEGLIPGLTDAARPPHYAPDVVILVETGTKPQDSSSTEKETGKDVDGPSAWQRTWLVGDAKLRRPSKTIETEVMRALLKYGVTTRPMHPADRMESVRLMCAIPERNFSGMRLGDLAPGAGNYGGFTPDVNVEVLTPDAVTTELVERVRGILENAGGEVHG